MVSVAGVDDMHLHVRDGEGLKSLGTFFPKYIRRAIIMPNLIPPVTTTEKALAYRDRVLAAVDRETFTPLMTLYLTDNTTGDEIRKAKATGHIYAVKLYPAGATTNSDSGVTDLAKVQEPLKAMAEIGMPLLIHGEVTAPSIDMFDREAEFIEQKLRPLVKQHPTLKVVMEHITTKEAVEFVMSQGPNVAATVTAHHLMYNRTALFQGGLQPHKYCLPVLKAEEHRQALRSIVQSGTSKVFMGTDSAPHPKERKEASCCSAGMFTGHAPLELYAEVFEELGCLDKLDAFVSKHAADFYGLERNGGTVVLEKESWTVPETYPFGKSEVVPVKAGQTIHWKVASVELE